MGEREGERDRAAEAVADQDGVVGDAEFLEAVLDRGHIGVHQRQQRRLRAVEARQVDQRDAMLGGERRQHRIEGVPVGEQRMQHHQVAALAPVRTAVSAPWPAVSCSIGIEFSMARLLPAAQNFRWAPSRVTTVNL